MLLRPIVFLLFGLSVVVGSNLWLLYTQKKATKYGITFKKIKPIQIFYASNVWCNLFDEVFPFFFCWTSDHVCTMRLKWNAYGGSQSTVAMSKKHTTTTTTTLPPLTTQFYPKQDNYYYSQIRNLSLIEWNWVFMYWPATQNKRISNFPFSFSFAMH